MSEHPTISSLYALHEVCEGCVHALWTPGRTRLLYDGCDVGAEGTVDLCHGTCPSRRTPTDSDNDSTEPKDG